MIDPKYPSTAIHVFRRRGSNKVRVFTRIRGPIITGKKIQQPVCSDYKTHTEALQILEKNKALVQSHIQLLETLKEKNDEVLQYQHQLFTFQASVKKEFEKKMQNQVLLLQDINQDFQKKVTQVVQSICGQTNDESFLEFCSPGRISDARKSFGVPLKQSTRPVSSITNIRLSATGVAKSHILTTEEKENHRVLALDKLDAQRYEVGNPLSPVDEMSSTYSSQIEEINANISREHLVCGSKSLPRGNNTIINPADMTLDSMRESHFGPTNCSTERKRSMSLQPSSQELIRQIHKTPNRDSNSSSQSRKRKEVSRCSIFEFVPAHSSPIVQDDGDESDDEVSRETIGESSGESYAGITSEDEGTRDSIDMDTSVELSGNGVRPSLLNSFIQSDSFRKTYAETSDDGDDDTLIDSALDKSTEPSVGIDLPTDSTVVDDLNQFIQSQQLTAPPVYDFPEEEQTYKKAKTPKATKETVAKKPPKSKKADEPKDGISSKSPLVSSTKTEASSSKRKNTGERKETKKSKGIKSSKVALLPLETSSSTSLSTDKQEANDSQEPARGSSLLEDSGEMNDSRYPKRSRKQMEYKEPNVGGKIRRGDPKWCKD